MHQKFFIALFFAIFYNGVTYASPVNERGPEGNLPDVKQSTDMPEIVSHINKEIEPTPPPIANHSITVTEKSSPALDHTGISTLKVTVHSSDNNKNASVMPQVNATKNMNQKFLEKNTSSVIDKKISSLITGDKNNGQAIDNKTMIPTIGTKNPIVPTEVPAEANSMAFSTPAAQTSTTSTTVIPKSTTSSTNSNVTLSTKEEAMATFAPNSASDDKVVMVYKVPAPGKDKHFDGPSFIGGMVLTVGLTAIGFIAFKYYKSGKIDMNYRTL